MYASDVTVKNDRISRYSNYISQRVSQQENNTIFNLDSGGGRNKSESTYLQTILGEYDITPEEKNRLLGINIVPPVVVIDKISSIVDIINNYSDTTLMNGFTQITTSPNGNLIAMDTTSNKIWSINQITGSVVDITPPTTIAGTISVFGQNLYIFDQNSYCINIYNSDNVLLKTIPFRNPTDPPPSILTVDATNNNIYYIAESAIYKITNTGGIRGTYSYPERILGSSAGFANGIGLAAQFNNPQGLVIDSSGNLCISDSGNSIIRTVDLTTLNVITYMGNDAFLAFNTFDGCGNRDDTVLSDRILFTNQGPILLDPSGNMFISDTGNNSIRVLIQNEYISTIGGVAGVDNTYYPSLPGYADGSQGYTLYNGPTSITYSKYGLYILDKGNNHVRLISQLF